MQPYSKPDRQPDFICQVSGWEGPFSLYGWVIEAVDELNALVAYTTDWDGWTNPDRCSSMRIECGKVYYNHNSITEEHEEWNNDDGKAIFEAYQIDFIDKAISEHMLED